MVGNSRYVDVNVFVYWLGNHPKLGSAAQKWIKKIEKSQKGNYVTSTLTLYETLVILAGLTGKNLKDKTLVNQVVKAVTSLKTLRVEPLKVQDYDKAADLKFEYNLDYEDALHLAVATRTKVLEIVSNDKDFDAAQMKRTF
jgi:predicted nucleic acid-binding protein